MENDRLLNVMRDTIRQYVEANKTKKQNYFFINCFIVYTIVCKFWMFLLP